MPSADPRNTAGRVRLRRRVVAHTQTIDVVVRREELIVETDGVESVGGVENYRRATLDGPSIAALPDRSGEPLVILLRKELPEIVTRTRVYERITANIDTVADSTSWSDSVRKEQIETDDPS